MWDAHLAGYGAEIVHARLTTLADLAEPAASAYADIAPTSNDARITYKSASLEEALWADGVPEVDAVRAAALLDAAQRRRPDEIARGR